MSSIFDLFLPLEHRNYASIQELQEEVSQSKLDNASLRMVQSLCDRVDRLELLNRALLEILMKRNLLNQVELDRVAQQVDLMDGVEDGKVSASVIKGAPTCLHCGRFVNPQRSACVFCGNAISESASTAKPPVRIITCAGCGASVPERTSYFSNRGVVCSPCFGSEQG